MRDKFNFIQRYIKLDGAFPTMIHAVVMVISSIATLGWFVKFAPLMSISVRLLGYSMITLFYIVVFQTDFSNYNQKINDWKVSLYIVVSLICWNYFSVIAMAPIVGFDPQHLLEMDKVGTIETLYKIPIFFIHATGEEYFKMSIFLGCGTLLPISRRYKMLVAMAISAVVFGVVHFVAWGWDCVIPIIIGSLPTYFVFYYFRSLSLVVSAHFFTNVITSIILLEDYGGKLFVAIAIIMFTFLLYAFCCKKHEPC